MESGGSLIIPPYAAIPRLVAVEDPKQPDGFRIDFRKEYRDVATEWGNAFSDFTQFKRSKNLTWKDYLVSIKKIAEDTMAPYLLRMRALYHYGRIQEADLYAHFSPVEFIMDEKLLKTDDFSDALGDLSIWDRLKKLGKDRFYRVEYDSDPVMAKQMSEEDKRIKEKEYVEGTGVNSGGPRHLIETAIADTPYVKNVLKAYIDGDKDAEADLYREPIRSDKEMQRIQKLFGTDVKNEINKQLLRDRELKRDNIRVVSPPIPQKK